MDRFIHHVGYFWYFIVLIDASIHQVYVSLLTTCNVAFDKLLVQTIRFQAQFPYYLIKYSRLDSINEFKS